ncbi:MAG: hypothetical protein ACPGJO_10345 [bacterium]
MTEQKIPDGSVDIVENVRKLETFIDKLLDGWGYEDPDGNLEVFNDQQILELEQGLLDGVPFDWDHVAERTLSDWLQGQLFIDVCYERTDDTKQDRNFNWVQLYRVSGWSIDITIGGPTVRLKRDPFRGGYTYIHSWGVVSWADPSGHFSPRTSIEFNSAIGDRIHEYIQEMYS